MEIFYTSGAGFFMIGMAYFSLAIYQMLREAWIDDNDEGFHA